MLANNTIQYYTMKFLHYRQITVIMAIYRHLIHLLEKTALDQGRTDRINLTHDLDLQSPVSCGHALLACKS